MSRFLLVTMISVSPFALACGPGEISLGTSATGDDEAGFIPNSEGSAATVDREPISIGDRQGAAGAPSDDPADQSALSSDPADPDSPPSTPANPVADAPLAGVVYYVRPGGGDASQCTGRANADYPGSGGAQPCAFKHPFVALPPGGTPLLKGGESLVIASGAYAMGLGAPAGAASCTAGAAWDCVMPAIPSGPDKDHPTRILGEGWSSGCAAPPELYGVQRPRQIIDLSGSSNVQLDCLEITDRDTCIENHKGGLACNRDSYPYGEWASIGLRASDAKNVTLRQLDIHGLAHTGVLAGRLGDWTVEDVRIAANGWVGWDGDLVEPQGSGNSGTLIFRRLLVEWNGCGETYPGGQPTGCWGQTAGGYGDGMGTAATGGDWIFEDSQFLHNTSDGLDMLYHSEGGTITIDRVRSEGNAGNQLKVAGNARIINTVAVGNCAFFEGKPFTFHVDACRAMGNTIEFAFTPGSKGELINSTIYGQGDLLVNSGARTSCNGSETLFALNNIFIGDSEFHSPGEKAGLFYQEGCAGLTFDVDFSVIHNVQDACPRGPNDLCGDPQLGALSGERFDMIPRASSLAIDTGSSTDACVPRQDCDQMARPSGGGIDRGAYEVGATVPFAP